ncbi:MAG: hypothetical protein ACOYLS_00130 [Polymorphobacter sp.]
MIKQMTRTFSISALLLLSALPVTAQAAGQGDQARAAIAEARGKVDASGKVAAGGDAMALQVRAREALVSAQASLNNGKKETAIADARHASELADLAIAAAERSKAGAVVDARIDASNTAAIADQAVAAADARAATAEQAAAAAALAAALPPASVTTVVTTEKELVQAPVAAKTTTKKKVVRKTPVKLAPKTEITTTTVVTPLPR